MLALFTLTVLVSATLLFLIQPMFARMVLPLLGSVEPPSCRAATAISRFNWSSQSPNRSSTVVPMSFHVEACRVSSVNVFPGDIETRNLEDPPSLDAKRSIWK